MRCFVKLPAAAGAAAAGWPLPGGDLQNTRDVASPINGSNVSTLGVAWCVPIEATTYGNTDGYATTPAVVHGVVYTQDLSWPDIARVQRRFLACAVRYLAGEAGIRQFLDIGTGLPTANNTHQVAQQIGPDARIVYVDNDRCKSGCAHARGRQAA